MKPRPTPGAAARWAWRALAAAGGTRPSQVWSRSAEFLEETARIVRDHAGADEAARRPRPTASPLTAPQVRAIVAARLVRREILGFDASEAAWAMLLLLYAEGLEGRRSTMNKLGVAAMVPRATAHRLTRRLIEAGILIEHGDPAGKHAFALGLSADVSRRIGIYLGVAGNLAPFVA